MWKCPFFDIKMVIFDIKMIIFDENNPKNTFDEDIFVKIVKFMVSSH